jgi:hypothetical protein
MAGRHPRVRMMLDHIVPDHRARAWPVRPPLRSPEQAAPFSTETGPREQGQFLAPRDRAAPSTVRPYLAELSGIAANVVNDSCRRWHLAEGPRGSTRAWRGRRYQ